MEEEEEQEETEKGKPEEEEKEKRMQGVELVDVVHGAHQMGHGLMMGQR